MAIVKKIKLPDNTVVDINDSRISGVDSTPTSGSTNVVTSGGVQAALTNGSVTKVGTDTVGASNRPIYLNAGIPTVTNPGEAFLSWGGQNLSGAFGPIDAAMVSDLGACRTSFLPASAITVEYSTDSGSTWSDYGASDSQKRALFSTIASFTIGKNTTAGGGNASKMLRVTISPYGSLYTTLNKFVILISTSGSSGCYCTIRAKRQTNVENNIDTWETFANQVPIVGWSGYNIINTSGLTAYGNSNAKSSQYGRIQFIFGCTGGSGNYTGLAVLRIMGFGGVGWTIPSNMAKTGHLYAYDNDQNATFPAKVTATQFVKSGGTSAQFLKADGSIDSNTYAKTNQLPAAPGTLTTTSTTALSTATNEALSGSISLHKVAKTGTYSDLVGKPTIPSAPGTLNTTATAAQSISSSEALSGNVTLHKISKTGSYEDLNSKPSFPTAVYYDPATEMLYFFKSTADKDSFVANKTQTSLVLFSTETSPYIKFKDSTIASVCATNWGDGTGITEMRASKSLSMANAFKNNTSITSFDELKYFTGITSLENAFQNSSLTKVTLPSGIVVGNSNNWVNIFNGCASLLEVDFSDFMRDETNTAARQRTYSFFAGCSSLTILRYSSIEQINNIVVDKYLATPTATDAPFQANNDVHYVYINGDELRDLIIPSTMTEIASGAFLGFNRITSVEFPSTLTRIGCFAFSGCSSLTKVEVPVAIIWRGAFTNCANLEEIIFTANISSWPGSCCDGCNALKKVVFTSITNIPNSTYFMNFSKTLDYLEFGASITSIGTWFLGTTVYVKTFVCRATTPPETGSGRIFYNRPTKIYVPYSSDHSVLNAYKTATNWSSWASYIFELNSDGSVPE